MEKKINNNFSEICKITIAIVIVIISIFKMQYYCINGEGMHDLSAHLGYLLYVEEHPKEMVPRFEEMKLVGLENGDEWKNYRIFNRNYSYLTWNKIPSINYLGHPPLYYKIINYFNPIQKIGDTIVFNMDTISICNMLITGIGIILLLYIGIKLRLNPIEFMFYAILSTSIPLITFLGGGLNNDNLGYIGISMVMISMIDINKGRRGYAQYLGLSIGVFICLMTKLTFGLVSVLVVGISMAIIIFEEKSVDVLLNKKFLSTIPIYLFTLIYYVIVLFRYHTIQPSLSSLDYTYFKSTMFYVEESNRVQMSFIQYLTHFFKNFTTQWQGIYGHKINRVSNWWQGIGYVLILYSPVVFIIISALKKEVSRAIENRFVLISSIAVVFTIGVQFIKGYKGFIFDGYLGGMQPRYYLACTGIMCLSYIYGLNILLDNKYKGIKNAIYLTIITMVIIADIQYFLCNGWNL